MFLDTEEQDSVFALSTKYEEYPEYLFVFLTLILLKIQWYKYLFAKFEIVQWKQ